MKTIPRPWLSTFYAHPIPELMSREAFVARFMPQYVRDYQPPMGIRLNDKGRPMMSTKGSVQSQITKRNNRIDEAYSAYCQDHAATVELYRRATEPTLL
jgi:hypothetical protein